MWSVVFSCGSIAFLCGKLNSLCIHCRCRGLLLLETYTTKEGDALKCPDFMEVEREVTNDPQYSMFVLSKS